MANATLNVNDINNVSSINATLDEGAGANSITLNNGDKLTKRGTYVINAADSLGNTKETTIILYDPPTITLNPDLADGEGTNKSVVVTYTGKGAQLKVGDENRTNATGSITLDASGTYNVTVTDEFKNAVQKSFVIDKSTVDAPIIILSSVNATKDDIRAYIKYSTNSFKKLYKIGADGRENGSRCG